MGLNKEKGSKRRPQKRIPSESSFFSRRIDRRTLLTGGLVLGGGATLAAVGVNILGNSDEPADTTPSQPKTPDTQPDPEDGKKILLQVIANLPESPTKDVYTRLIPPVVSPKENKPFQFRDGEFEFRVYSSSVTINHPPGLEHPNGSYISKGIGTPQNLPVLTEDLKIVFPLNNIIAPPDFLTFPKASDGTTSILEFNAKRGATYSDGLAPEITVDRADHSRIPSDARRYMEVFEDFLLLKESAGCALDILLAKQTRENMQRFGFKTEARVQDIDGTTRSTDTVFSPLRDLQRKNGRYLAAVEIGGVFLAIKAMQGMPELDILHQNPVMARVIDRVSVIEFGKTPEEILESTFQFGLNYQFYAEIQPNISGDRTLVP